MGCGAAKPKKVAMAEGLDQDKIDKAILNLKVTRDRLTKYQNRQEYTRDLEMQKARELLQANKVDKARLVLKQRKIRETYINNAQKELENIESMINTIETKQMEMEVIRNLDNTNNILKQMNELMPVEEVERIMDENEEQADRLKEINDILSRNMSHADNESAEEAYEALLAELQVEHEGTVAATPQVTESAVSDHEYSESEDRVPMAA